MVSSFSLKSSILKLVIKRLVGVQRNITESTTTLRPIYRNDVYFTLGLLALHIIPRIVALQFQLDLLQSLPVRLGHALDHEHQTQAAASGEHPERNVHAELVLHHLEELGDDDHYDSEVDVAQAEGDTFY